VSISASAPTPRRGTRAAERIGHHAFPLYLAGTIALIPLDLLRTTFTIRLFNTACVLVMAGIWWLGYRHTRRLCEPCIASMPLNGQEEAARKRRRLRYFHWVADDPSGRVRRGVPVPGYRVLLLIALIIVPDFLVPDHGWLLLAVSTATLSPLLYLQYASIAHFRLQAWCPQCHWGSGGDGAKEPSPDPSTNLPTPQPV
jgi:hypothetical protein